MIKRKPFEPQIDTRGEFEPKLPSSLLKRGGGILGKIKAMSRSGKGKKFVRASQGRRGKVRSPKSFKQRVIIKARVVKESGKAAVQKMRAHLSYLNRSGVGLSEKRAQFFNTEGEISKEKLSKKSADWEKDPHHFRFIISPENAAELDLEAYAKKVLQTMEKELGTRLEWYGTCHYNTDNPHAHIVLRGVDERGQALLISRDYLSYGIRSVAEEEATLRLGKKGPGEVEKSIEKTLKQERFTFIDKELLRTQELSSNKTLELTPQWGVTREWERKGRVNKLKRLSFLESRGLASEVKTGVWKLKSDLKEVLTDLSERRKIERLISPFLSVSEARKQELVIHKECEPFKENLRGIVVAKELLDELFDKRFMLLSADDGRTHFIPLGRFSEALGFESKVGQVVSVSPPEPPKVRAEEVISRYLGGSGGAFSLEAFEAHVKGQVAAKKWALPIDMSVDEYLKIFSTRCDTLCRAGILTELAEEQWEVPAALEQRVKEYEEVTKKKLKISVVVDSHTPLSEQAKSGNAVWVDRFLGAQGEAVEGQGIYHLEVTRALRQRQEELNSRGVLPAKEVFYSLLEKDKEALLAKLKGQFGHEHTLKVGEQIKGRVLNYELLGDGYRMVTKTELGFVVRKVGKKEAQLPYGSEVTLSKEVRVIKGRKREIVRASPTVTSKAQGRGRGRK